MARQCNDQKFEETKDVIRRRNSQMARQYTDQKFEDTKDVNRRRKSRMLDNTLTKRLKTPKM
jgi:hypothetical protein